MRMISSAVKSYQSTAQWRSRAVTGKKIFRWIPESHKVSSVNSGGSDATPTITRDLVVTGPAEDLQSTLEKSF